MIKKSIILMIALITSMVSFAQTNLDSLYAVWLDETQTDSLRTVAYDAYIHDGFIKSDPDSAIILADELIDFGNERNYHEAISYGHELKGNGYYRISKFPQALAQFKEALAIAERAGYEKFKGGLMNTIGVLYGTLGNEGRALEFYERGYRVSEEMNDKPNMEMCVSNIGEIYFELENYPRALEYLERGLALEKEMGDSLGYAMSLNLIAGVYRKQRDFKRALSYSEQALIINEAFDDTGGIAASLFSIGDTYKEQKKYSLAIQYFKNGLEIDDGRASTEFNVASLIKIGSTYKEQGDYLKAVSYCKQGLELASNSGMLVQQMNACECLYMAHRSLNNGNYALEYLEEIRTLDDNLNTQELNNRLQHMEIEKQALEDSIANVEKERMIELAHREVVQKKNRTKNIAIVGALFILLIAAGLYSRWRSVRRSKAIIEKEKARSDELLLNILPAEIAEELKESGQAEARMFDQVTVLFTDFKGFTAMSEQLSPEDLVNDLNLCFSEFDQITSKYGIEKIKTIGDAYMAVGGLPTPNTTHAQDVIKAALEMCEFVEAGKARKIKAGRPYFEIRVGVHSGPVVAGIVGVKKFQYDIWGNTVNTASRMESSGAVGQVNISEATYELVKDTSSAAHGSQQMLGGRAFSFTSRGKVEAKGKGRLEMYFVSRSMAMDESIKRN